MTFPICVCCTPELSKFLLEEALPVDELFRSFLPISHHNFINMGSTLIFITKIISNLKEIELNLDSRDRKAYEAISDYMNNMLAACAELCPGAKMTVA